MRAMKWAVMAATVLVVPGTSLTAAIGDLNGWGYTYRQSNCTQPQANVSVSMAVTCTWMGWRWVGSTTTDNNGLYSMCVVWDDWPSCAFPVRILMRKDGCLYYWDFSGPNSSQYESCSAGPIHDGIRQDKCGGSPCLGPQGLGDGSAQPGFSITGDVLHLFAAGDVRVSLKLYSADGRLATTLLEGSLSEGGREFSLSALRTGTYIARLVSDGVQQSVVFAKP